MDELADSSGLLRDPQALRGRLAADGYLFFRGLLPVEPVRAAGTAVAGRLQDGGWITPAGLTLGPPRGRGPKDALADPAYRRAVIGLAFNRIPYLPELRGLVRGLLGPQAFSYPVKVLRTVYPERAGSQPTLGRYTHYDYGGAGVADMLTTWLPLMNVPAELGGLAVLPGGHRERVRRPHLLKPAERGWVTTDYRVGDVIVFHCLTPHAALPNAASALRISGDFRWQAPGQAPAEFVLGPGGGQRELFSRLLRWQRWWEPVPKGLVLRPKSELLARPVTSGLFAVHPSWRRWRPPPGEVH